MTDRHGVRQKRTQIVDLPTRGTFTSKCTKHLPRDGYRGDGRNDTQTIRRRLVSGSHAVTSHSDCLLHPTHRFYLVTQPISDTRSVRVWWNCDAVCGRCYDCRAKASRRPQRERANEASDQPCPRNIPECDVLDGLWGGLRSLGISNANSCHLCCVSNPDTRLSDIKCRSTRSSLADRRCDWPDSANSETIRVGSRLGRVVHRKSHRGSTAVRITRYSNRDGQPSNEVCSQSELIWPVVLPEHGKENPDWSKELQISLGQLSSIVNCNVQNPPYSTSNTTRQKARYRQSNHLAADRVQCRFCAVELSDPFLSCVQPGKDTQCHDRTNVYDLFIRSDVGECSGMLMVKTSLGFSVQKPKLAGPPR